MWPSNNSAGASKPPHLDGLPPCDEKSFIIIIRIAVIIIIWTQCQVHILLILEILLGFIEAFMIDSWELSNLLTSQFWLKKQQLKKKIENFCLEHQHSAISFYMDFIPTIILRLART